METLKSVIGLGSKSSTQEGQEPVSGVQGQGTAGEPYDAGNTVGMSFLAMSNVICHVRTHS